MRLRLLPLRSTGHRLTHVDASIFTLRSVGSCLACTTCHDWCCQFGCDVDVEQRDRLLAVKDELARFVSTPVEGWFEPGEAEDPEVPGGRFVRTGTVRRGGRTACAFLRAEGRGCSIHRFALATGRDYHQLKPTVCWLFPLTWDAGVLQPAEEARSELVCAGAGPTLYATTREELGQVFGAALVHELDHLQVGLGAPGPRLEAR